jgi:hypothetical protein
MEITAVSDLEIIVKYGPLWSGSLAFDTHPIDYLLGTGNFQQSAPGITNVELSSRTGKSLVAELIPRIVARTEKPTPYLAIDRKPHFVFEGELLEDIHDYVRHTQKYPQLRDISQRIVLDAIDREQARLASRHKAASSVSCLSIVAVLSSAFLGPLGLVGLPIGATALYYENRCDNALMALQSLKNTVSKETAGYSLLDCTSSMITPR